MDLGYYKDLVIKLEKYLKERYSLCITFLVYIFSIEYFFH